MNMLQQKIKIEDNREKLDLAPVLPALMSGYLLVTLLHQVLTPSLQLLTIKYSENSFLQSHLMMSAQTVSLDRTGLVVL